MSIKMLLISFSKLSLRNYNKISFYFKLCFKNFIYYNIIVFPKQVHTGVLFLNRINRKDAAVRPASMNIYIAEISFDTEKNFKYINARVYINDQNRDMYDIVLFFFLHVIGSLMFPIILSLDLLSGEVFTYIILKYSEKRRSTTAVIINK